MAHKVTYSLHTYTYSLSPEESVNTDLITAQLS